MNGISENPLDYARPPWQRENYQLTLWTTFLMAGIYIFALYHSTSPATGDAKEIAFLIGVVGSGGLVASAFKSKFTAQSYQAEVQKEKETAIAQTEKEKAVSVAQAAAQSGPPGGVKMEAHLEG